MSLGFYLYQHTWHHVAETSVDILHERVAIVDPMGGWTTVAVSMAVVEIKIVVITVCVVAKAVLHVIVKALPLLSIVQTYQRWQM